MTKPFSSEKVTLLGCTASPSPLILIIEDEVIGRETLKLMLQHYKPCQFALTATGQDSLTFYEKYYARIIGVFMDIMLPDINGFELFQQFITCKKPSVPRPIIAFTAHNDETIVKNLLAHGFFDHLGKPYTKTELLSKCHMLLQTHNLSTATATSSPPREHS